MRCDYATCGYKLLRMDSLFSSPGMLTSLGVVFLIEVLSLLLLFVNVRIFRSQSNKYRLLLSGMGNQSAFGSPGRMLIPLYIALALGATIVTTLIFITQPHLL